MRREGFNYNDIKKNGIFMKSPFIYIERERYIDRR